MPPSTSISKTMSASVSPDCGRAAGSFGTRATIGRRFVASALGASVPRSGQMAFAAGATLALGAPPTLGGAPPHATTSIAARIAKARIPRRECSPRARPRGARGPRARGWLAGARAAPHRDHGDGRDDPDPDQGCEQRLERPAPAVGRDAGEGLEPVHGNLRSRDSLWSRRKPNRGGGTWPNGVANGPPPARGTFRSTDSTGASLDRSAEAGSSRSPAIHASGARSTSAPPAAASGRRPTAAPTGGT